MELIHRSAYGYIGQLIDSTDFLPQAHAFMYMYFRTRVIKIFGVHILNIKKGEFYLLLGCGVIS
jgi:hypothetical protein